MRLLFTALAFLISVSVLSQNQQSIVISENQWIEIPAWQTSTSYTLSAWVFFPLPNPIETNWHTLFSKYEGGDHHIMFHYDGELGIYKNNEFHACGFSSNEIENGFHYITSVATGGATFFYVDGELVGNSGEQIYGLMHTIGNIAAPFGGGNQPIGQIDDVSIWSYAQTDQEINQFMNCPPIGVEGGLISHYNFESVLDDIVYSISPFNGAYDGTLEGEPVFSFNTPENNCGLDSDDCDGQDFCGDGTIWDSTTQTCVSENDPSYPDNNGDNCVDINDLLNLLIFFGTCE